MPHGDAVVDGDGIELGGETALFFNLRLHELPYFVQMHVPGDELRERIDDGDDGLSHLFFLHAVGDPQGAGACHASALGAERAA